MQTSTGSLPRRWQDKTNLALGLLVLVSPWLLGYSGAMAAAWNAWIMGAVFAVGTLAVLAGMPTWLEWAVGFCGLWTFLAPRILTFTDSSTATVFQMVVGGTIAILAVWSAIAASHARLAAGSSEPPVRKAA